MLLKGKRFLVTGIASKLSIAWGIAESLHREGAQLAFTYPNEKIKKRVVQAAEQFGEHTRASVGQDMVLPCDVSSDDDIANCFAELKQHWTDGLDGVIHAIGFAPADQLDGNFADITTREGFAVAHDISAYSFVALAHASKDMLAQRQGALLTLTYHGAQQVLPNYNVMGLAKASLEASVRYLASSLGAQGIRVNAISAGPIRTLAASGIKNFRNMLDVNASIAPLQRNINIQEVGNTAVFLLSPWASGITAEIIYVDAGFHAVALSEKLLAGQH